MSKIIRNLNSDFKENSVLLSYERKNVKEKAIELGVTPKLLSKWKAYSHSLINQQVLFKEFSLPKISSENPPAPESRRNQMIF